MVPPPTENDVGVIVLFSLLTPENSMKSKPFVLAASIAALLSNSASAQLQPTGWIGDGTDTKWSNVDNWDLQVVPGGNVRDLYFGIDFLNSPAGTNSVISNNDLIGYQGHRITFETGTNVGFMITGNGFTLFDFSGAFPRIENNSTALQTFNLTAGESITLDGTNAGNKAEINAVAGNMLFTGTTTVALAGNTQLQIFGNAGTTLTFAGGITGAGTGGVQMNQLGKVVYSGTASNTYAGATTVNSGTLELNKATGSTAIAGDLTISGGTVQLIAGDQIADTSNVTLTSGTLDLNGQTDTFGSLTYQGGSLAFNGTQPLMLAGTGVALTARNVTINNPIALTGATGGDIVFDATSNGTAVLNAVDLGGAVRTITVANGTAATDMRIAGAIGGAGFLKAGAGTLELSGADANVIAGPTLVNNGIVLLNKMGVNALNGSGLTIASNNTAGFGAAVVRLAASNQIDDNMPIVLDANGGVNALLDLANFTETVGPVTFNSATVGGALVRIGATGTLTLNGDLTFNNNRNATGNNAREVLITGTGTRDTAGVGGTLNLGGVARTITVNANFTGANLTNADATIEAAIANGSIIKAGTRILRLGAVNSYSALTVNNGTVRALVDGAIPANIPLTVAGDAGQTATLDFNGLNYTLTAANNLQLGGAGTSVIATGAGTLTLAVPLPYTAAGNPGTSTISGKLDLGGTNNLFNIPDSSGTTTELLISAVISGSTSGINKIGAGTLALSGANAFTGPVLVAEGTLALRGQNVVPVSPTVANGAILQFDAGLANNTEFNNILGAAANGISVDGGTVRAAMQTTANVDRTFTNRLITVGAGGVTIDTSGIYTNFVEGIFSQLRFAGASVSGSGSLTKTGGGRLQFQTANPNFSGPVTVTDGTFEVAGGALGNASATNTVTINGGNVAISGGINQPLVTLAGGAISTNGSSQTVTAPSVVVASASNLFLNNFWTDASAGHSMTFSGVLSGPGNLLIGVNRAGYDANSGAVVLQNTANTLSGMITVGKNLSLTSAPTSGVGSTIGTASVDLMSGKLNLRDNGVGNNGTLVYGNNVSVTPAAGIATNGDLAGTATITVDRSTGFNTGNKIELGTLTISDSQLDVAASSGYSVVFGGMATFANSPTLNVTSGVLTLAGGLTATGQTFTKTGAGTLRLLGPVDVAGYTLSAGTIETAAEPGGVGRTLALPLGVGFGAGYVATQANLIDRVNVDSEGVVALGVSSTFNPDFSAFVAGPNGQRLRFGATADATLTGTITPSLDDIYRLGGGGGTLTLATQNALTGARALDVNVSGTTAGTVILANTNNYTGATTVGGGMTLGVTGTGSLGASTSLTLDNGTLLFVTGGDFSGFAPRLVDIGAGGGGLDTNGANAALSGLNGVAATSFSKYGAGTLTLPTTNPFAGKTFIRGGTVDITGDTGLGVVPGATVADQLRLEGGGFLRANGSFTIPAARGVTTGSNGGGIEVTGGNAVTLASILAGAGSFTKEGTGTLTITADPSLTGGFIVNAGVLELNMAAGSTDSSKTINAGGTLRTLSNDDIGDGQTVTVNAGGTWDARATDTIARLLGSGLVTKGSINGATISLTSTTNSTFSGIIENGLGTLGITKGNSNTVTFTGTNTYTGNTTVNTGQMRVEGATARLSNGGLVTIGDNNGNDESIVFGLNTDEVTTALDRIGNTSELEFRGSTSAIFNGPAVTSTAFSETLGNIDFKEGTGQLILVPAAGGQIELTASSLIREFNNASGVVRGTNLGGTGANSSRVFVTTIAPTLVGGNGVGSLASIVPFLIGGTSTTAAPNTFLRYDATTGLTPLASGDYASAIAGSTGRNVSVAGGESIGADGSINALRLTGGTTTVNGRLQVDSGAVLFTDNATIAGSGSLAYGTRQALFLVSGDTTSRTAEVNTSISTSAGLSFGDAGDIGHTLVLGGNNAIFGGVTVNGGTLRAGNAGALNSVIFNDLALRAGNSATGGALSSVFQLGGNSLSVVFNGNDRLQGSTRIQNASATPATITIISNVASAANDGVLENGSGGGALSLIKRGTASLSLEQNNTFTGTVELLAGTTQLTTANGRFSGLTGLTIRGNAILNLFNTSAANNTDRVNGNAPIAMHGGQIQFDNDQNAADYTETLGALSVLNGNNIITKDFAASGRPSILTVGSMTVAPGASLHFTNFGTTGDIGIGESGTRNQVIFTTDPTTTNGILGGSVYFTKNFATTTTFDPVDFASYDVDTDGAGADLENGVMAFAGYETGANALWTNVTVARPAALETLGASRDVYALKLGHDATLGPITVDVVAGQTLNVTSGGIIFNPNTTAASNSTINNGTLTAGGTAAAELAVRVDSNISVATLTIGSIIADNGGVGGIVSLLKTGADALVLSASNTYTGRTTVAEGVLSIAADNGLGAVPAVPTPGHLRLHGGALNVTSTMTLEANRGIEVGGSGGVIDVRGSSNTLTYNGAITSNGTAALTFQGERTVSGTTATVANANFTPSGAMNMDGDFAFNLDGTVVLSGAVNRFGSGFQVGANQSTASLTYSTPGGTLILGGVNPNGNDVNIGVRPTLNSDPTTTISKGTVDLTGSENLIVRANNLNLGVNSSGTGGSSQAEGHLIIGTNSDIIAATQVLISNSNSAGNDTPLPSEIVFGSGVNTVQTPLMTVGGYKGDGKVSIAAGGVLSVSGVGGGLTDLYVARNPADTGTNALGNLDATGGTLVARLNNLVVGEKTATNLGRATGSLTVSGPSNVISANNVVIGNYTNATLATGNVVNSGTINFGGGSFSVANNVLIAGFANNTPGAGGSYVSNGTFNITGGSVTVGGDITTANSTSANATVNLNGGSLDMTGGIINVDTFTAASGALHNVAQIQSGDGATVATLTKTSPGTLTVGGTNAYTGATKINDGTLVLAGALTGTSSVEIASLGTLAGSGTINPAAAITVATGGTVAPGTSAGQLNIGSITFDADSKLVTEIGGLIAGTQYDQLNVTGAISLSGNLEGALTGGYVYHVFDVFTIMLNDGTDPVVGSFANGALNPEFSEVYPTVFFDGKAFLVSYNAEGGVFDAGAAGNDVALMAIPEPSSAIALLTGLGAVLGFRRSRRQTRA